MELENPKRGSKFIYFAHIWMKKKIYFWRGVIQVYRIPVKKKYSTTRMSKNAAEPLNSA
jgi:hypothetical protein